VKGAGILIGGFGLVKEAPRIHAAAVPIALWALLLVVVVVAIALAARESWGPERKEDGE